MMPTPFTVDERLIIDDLHANSMHLAFLSSVFETEDPAVHMQMLAHYTSACMRGVERLALLRAHAAGTA